MAQQRCGGTGDIKQATPEIQNICDQLKEEILQKSDKSSSGSFNAISYKSQIVAGTNYFIKIKIEGDGEEYIHVRIYQPLPHTGQKCELHSVQTGKGRDDAVEYF